jgi:hypothetical protein
MQIESLELIGYDPQTSTFPSKVLEPPAPSLPYRWEVDDGTLRISVSLGPLDPAFTGTFDEDGDGLAEAGGRTPEPTRRSTCAMTSAGPARDRCRAT